VVNKVAAAVVTIAAVSAVGCAARKSPPPSGQYNVLDRYEQDGDGEGSLFKGDAVVLSDVDIARILASPATVAGNNRLAVLKLGSTKFWSEEHAKAEEQTVVSLLGRLRSASAVTYAGELPKLLVPEKKTVPFLREAAARYRADLLFVYDTTVRTFTKYRTLGKDEVRASCSVEAVLLDVRTGLVPFTARKVEEVSATRSVNDIDFSETIAKAVASAEGKALDGIAAETVAFLGGKR
jgi:hypothetical protein